MNVDLAERWITLKPMLEALLEAPEAERAALLDRLAPNDAGLRATLERLLDTKDATTGVVSRRFDPAHLVDAIARRIDDDAAWIGRSLGAYRLTRTLGSGGMGTVFVAEREGGGFGQQVAVKVFKASWISEGMRARFERERQILATLRHPNIAALFDGGDTREGLPWYAMEHVDGVDIGEHCRMHAHDIPSRVRLLLEVAAALSYAHQHLVVHRDIKPSNILVSAEGRVKLLDFGIAKLLGDAGGAGVTEAALGPMTPEYAAPEQFRGDAVTVATDVFQFGTLAYRLLTGHFPYDADPADRYAWSRAVSENDPKSLTWAIARGIGATWSERANVARIRRTLRGDLGAILAMALAKAPGDRYRSMDAMIGDLEAWLAGRPVVARGRGAAYQAWRFLSRRPWVSAGAALALAAILTASVVALRQARRAEREWASVLATTTSLITLMNQANPDINGTAQLDARVFIDRAVASIDKNLAAQPRSRAQLLAAAGDDLMRLGDFVAGEAVWADVVAAYVEARDVERPDFARALAFLAWMKYRNGKSSEALNLLNEAEARLGQHRSQAHDYAHAALLNFRGLIHADMGDLLAGRRDLESALLFANEPLVLSATHRNFAIVLRRLDDYDEALAQAELAYATVRSQFGEDHYRTAAVAVALADLFIDLGDIERASAIVLTLEPQLRKRISDVSIEFPLAETMLGNLARAEQRYDDAVRDYGEAEAAYVAKLGQDHPYRAKPIHEAGVAEYDRGHIEAALDDFNRALTLRERTLPPDHPEIAQTLDARALALARDCRLQEALADSERAVTVRRKVLPYHHSSTVDGLRHLAMIRQLASQSGVGDLLIEARERAIGATMYSKKPSLMAALEAEISDPATAAKSLGCKR